MITAKQAFDKTYSSIDAITKDELTKIEIAINNAIKKGQYSIDWFKECSEKTREELIKLGYDVKEHPYDPRDFGFSGYSISWKKI